MPFPKLTVPREKYTVIRDCTVVLLTSGFLTADRVTADARNLIDWRSKRYGETVISQGDAFTVAKTFVHLVGAAAAYKACRGMKDPMLRSALTMVGIEDEPPTSPAIPIVPGQ